MEIGPGIALERERLIPIEVDRRAGIVRKIGVLHGAVADSLGESLVAAALLDDIESPALRLGEKFLKADEIAFAGRNRLTLETHETERNVDELNGIAHLRGNQEELLEVKLLTVVGNVNDALGIVIRNAAADACEIARRIIVAAVRLADDRDAKLLGFKIDDESALGFLGKLHVEQSVDDARHHRVIERFTAIGVELDAELGVHALELADGDFNELLPELEIFGVALLEFNELCAACILPDSILLLRLRGGKDVTLLEIRDGEIVALLLRKALAVALDENTELGAPVAEMVVGDNVVAESAEDAVDGVADHGRADMADMHLLGGVGRGIVDYDFLTRAGLGNSRPVGGGQFGKALSKPLAAYGKIKKSGARDFHLFKARLVKRVYDFRCRLARIKADFFRDFERIVALVVAELGVGRGNNSQRGEVLAGERGLKRRLYGICQCHFISFQ